MIKIIIILALIIIIAMIIKLLLMKIRKIRKKNININNNDFIKDWEVKRIWNVKDHRPNLNVHCFKSVKKLMNDVNLLLI